MATGDDGRDESGRPDEARLPYLGGLDGLRALAVGGVLLYHANAGLRGGFLGVEIFFALSGFLITALLLGEWRRDGRIDLPAFWGRRARRLLPALGLLLAGVVVIAGVLPRGEIANLRQDIIAALGYVMNWHLIAEGQPYFDPLVRPPLLQHLWSLAVEEQFYLLWPPIFALGMRWLGRGKLRLATLALAGGAAMLMARGYEPGADPSRLYYGTDTRIAGILLGAAFALEWAPWREPGKANRGAGLLLDGLGALALAGLLAGFIWGYASHPWLYRGGFAATAAATIIVIAAVSHPRARLLPLLLRWRPLRWIGQRSYGIYLWHWPVFMVTRPYLDVSLSGLPLLALRIGGAVLLAELSYRFVERPIQRMGLRAAGRRIGAALARLAGSPGQPVSAGIIHRPAQPAWLARTPRQRAMRMGSLLCVSGLLISSGACTAPPPAADNPATLTAPSNTPPASDTPLPSNTPPASDTPLPSNTPPPSNTPAATAIPTIDPALAAELQAILDQTVADGAIPGAVASVSLPGRQPWVGASGVAERASGRLMAPDSLVRIASISKMFTAVTVLRLAEQGRLSLDDTIADILPGLVPADERITVKMLLSHTSGLYDYLEDSEFRTASYANPQREWEPEELVAYARQFPLAFEPGAPGSWDYSSTNYVILGMLAEQATGQPLAQLMREEIFAPLGLERTFFAPDEPPAGDLASGYARTVDQTDAAMSFAFATANLISTAGDMDRFARGLFGGELLSAESLALMQTFIDGKGQYKMPALAYGLGVMRNQLPVGPAADGSARPAAAGLVLGHIGGFAGFRSALWAQPGSGIVITLAVNQSDMDPNTLAAPLLDAVLRSQEGS